jgi:hypothetical protein
MPEPEPGLEQGPSPRPQPLVDRATGALVLSGKAEPKVAAAGLWSHCRFASLLIHFIYQIPDETRCLAF